MQQLINDLLSFSRVGRTTAAFTEVALDDALPPRSRSWSPPLRASTARSRSAPLPAVQGDASLLRALFVNLIGNGLEFHREGVPPRVRVAAQEVGDEWQITVSDNGIGIDPTTSTRFS